MMYQRHRTEIEICAEILQVLRDQGPMTLNKLYQKARLKYWSIQEKYIELLKAQKLLTISRPPGSKLEWAEITANGIQYCSAFHRLKSYLEGQFQDE